MLLARDEKEKLLLELFPSVADKFLRGRRKAEWQASHPEPEASPVLAVEPEPEPEVPEIFPESFWIEVLAWAGA
jgi:hypothetical protein